MRQSVGSDQGSQTRSLTMDQNIVKWFVERKMLPPGIMAGHIIRSTLNEKGKQRGPAPIKPNLRRPQPPVTHTQIENDLAKDIQRHEQKLTPFGRCLLDTGYLLVQLLLHLMKGKEHPYYAVNVKKHEQWMLQLESMSSTVGNVVVEKLKLHRELRENGGQYYAIKSFTEAIMSQLQFTPQSRMKTWNALDKIINALLQFDMGVNFKMMIIAGDTQSIAILLDGLFQDWIASTQPNSSPQDRNVNTKKKKNDNNNISTGGYLGQFQQQMEVRHNPHPSKKSHRLAGFKSRKRVSKKSRANLEPVHISPPKKERFMETAPSVRTSISTDHPPSEVRSITAAVNDDTTRTLLDFLVAALSEAMRLNISHAIELLTVETQQFSEMVILTRDDTIQRNIRSWYERIYTEVEHLIQLLAQEPHSADFAMSVLSLGMQSENVGIAYASAHVVRELSTKLMHAPSIQGNIWEWFTGVKGGMDVLLYTIHRNQYKHKELVEVAMSALLQFSQHSLEELFTGILNKRFSSAAQYFDFILQFIGFLNRVEPRMDIGMLTLECMLYATQHCDANHGIKDRIAAFRFLFGYWTFIPEVVERDVSIAKTILSRAKMACTDDIHSENLLTTLHSLLVQQYGFLSQRVTDSGDNRKHIRNIVKILLKSLVSTFPMDLVRTHLLSKLMEMLASDLYNPMLLDKIMNVYANYIVHHKNVKLNTGDCEFLVSVSNAPTLSPNTATMILSSLTETVVGDESLADHASVPFLIICKNNPTSEELAQFIQMFSGDILTMYMNRPLDTLGGSLTLRVLKKIIGLNIAAFNTAIENALINTKMLVPRAGKHDNSDLAKLLVTLQEKPPSNEHLDEFIAKFQVETPHNDAFYEDRIFYADPESEFSMYDQQSSTSERNDKNQSVVDSSDDFTLPDIHSKSNSRDSNQRPQSHRKLLPSIAVPTALPLIHVPPEEQEREHEQKPQNQQQDVPQERLDRMEPNEVKKKKKGRQLRADNYIARIKEERLERQRQQEEEQRLVLERKRRVKRALKRKLKWYAVGPKLKPSELFVDIEQQKEKLRMKQRSQSERVENDEDDDDKWTYIEEEVEVTDNEAEIEEKEEEEEVQGMESENIEDTSVGIVTSLVHDILFDGLGIKIHDEDPPAEPEPREKKTKKVIMRRRVPKTVPEESLLPKKGKPGNESSKKQRRKRTKRRPADTKRPADADRLRFFSSFTTLQRPIALFCKNLFLTISDSVVNGTAQERFRKQDLQARRRIAKRKKLSKLREKNHQSQDDSMTPETSKPSIINATEEPGAIEQHRKRIEERKRREEKRRLKNQQKQIEKMKRRTEEQKRKLQEYYEKREAEQKLEQEEMQRKREEKKKKKREEQQRQEEEFKRKKFLIEEFRAKKEQERIQMKKAEEEEQAKQQEQRLQDLKRFEHRKLKKEKKRKAAEVIQRAWRRRYMMIALSRYVSRIKAERSNRKKLKEKKRQELKRKQQEREGGDEKEDAVNETEVHEGHDATDDRNSPPDNKDRPQYPPEDMAEDANGGEEEEEENTAPSMN